MTSSAVTPRASYPWWATTVMRSQAAEKPFRGHPVDVGILVGVWRVGNGVIAIATPLDAIEDNTNQHDQEESAKSSTKRDQHGNAPGVTMT